MQENMFLILYNYIRISCKCFDNDFYCFHYLVIFKDTFHILHYLFSLFQIMSSLCSLLYLLTSLCISIHCHIVNICAYTIIQGSSIFFHVILCSFFYYEFIFHAECLKEIMKELKERK